MVKITEQVREIKIVRMPKGHLEAFYRFVGSGNLYWHSMRVCVARQVLSKGYGTWNGTRGPAVQHSPQSSTGENLIDP